jgi:uncharacterized membrane protein
MSNLYDLATAVVTGMMVGNEFAIAAFVHPQLQQLDDLTHARSARVLASSLGKFMPLWYGISLLLILGTAYEHRPLASGPGLLITLAAVLWAATIVFTISKLVPINSRIAKMDAERPHKTWLEDRAHWDRLHRIRVVLLTVSLVLLLTGLFQAAPFVN